MAFSPERKTGVPEGVQERPTEIPPEVERTGATVTSSQVKTQVVGDDDQPLTQSPATQAVSIQLPATQKQLDDWSHGEPSNALTWFALFWQRLIKKALHFGWRIFGKGKQ